MPKQKIVKHTPKWINNNKMGKIPCKIINYKSQVRIFDRNYN